ncbi:MAG: hypothetical protein PHI12_06465 [Dehalococcoidales bacterium]|nr:hypothetical protein [Dehalococcoidales bacterium]
MREDEDLKNKIAKGIQSSPNKPEKALGCILNRYHPGEWEYNDGKLVLDGLIPDYINKNGLKAVIEMYGDYWHGPKRVLRWKYTELGRIMAYNTLGFKCLIIWEKELKNVQSVAQKVDSFFYEKGKNSCTPA